MDNAATAQLLVMGQLITAGGVVLTAMIGGAATYFAARSLGQSRSTHHLINSRMDELLELTRATSHAAGVQAQRDLNTAVRAAVAAEHDNE